MTLVAVLGLKIDTSSHVNVKKVKRGKKRKRKEKDEEEEEEEEEGDATTNKKSRSKCKYFWINASRKVTIVKYRQADPKHRHQYVKAEVGLEECVSGMKRAQVDVSREEVEEVLEREEERRKRRKKEEEREEEDRRKKEEQEKDEEQRKKEEQKKEDEQRKKEEQREERKEEMKEMKERKEKEEIKEALRKTGGGRVEEGDEGETEARGGGGRRGGGSGEAGEAGKLGKEEEMTKKAILSTRKQSDDNSNQNGGKIDNAADQNVKMSLKPGVEASKENSNDALATILPGQEIPQRVEAASGAAAQPNSTLKQKFSLMNWLKGAN